MKYWAADFQGKKLAKELYARVDEWYGELSASGYFSMVKKAYRTYYGSNSEHGSIFDSSKIRRTGEQGELHRIKINDYRNILQHLLVLMTNPRPAWQARATNSDYKSQSQTILADGILEYYMREKRVERYLWDAAELAIVTGKGYVVMDWNASDGDAYGVDPKNGKQVNVGDINFKVGSQFEVACDVNRDNDDHDWLIFVSYKNKWDLIAKYPEYKEEIEKIPTKDHEHNKYSFSIKKNFSSDLIRVYTFRHRKSEALPKGRMVDFVSDEVVLYDGPLPYEKTHIYSIQAAPLHGSPFGYSPAFDLLSVQEAEDSLWSSLVTNNLTFATQNVLMPRGANISVSEIAGQMNLLTYDPAVGKPEPLNLTASAPESYKLLEMLQAKQETLAGINSVVRGNPESSLKSGAALALVASQAIQFNSRLQQSYVQLLEDVGTGIISLLKEYAAVPRIAMIVGKHNRPYLKEFKGDDLMSIARVTVDVGSAVSRTAAGKVQIADNLLEKGMIKNPDEYLAVIQTGRLDPMTEGQTAQLLLIKSENEQLREGNSVSVVATEDHRLHIIEHQAVLANPESKKNPQVVEATMSHIEEHVRLARETDPGLLMLLGQQPIPPLQPPAAPSMAPGMPQQQAGGVAGGPPLPPEMVTPDQSIPGLDELRMPNPPNMPTNPLTGEEFDNVTGGIE